MAKSAPNLVSAVVKYREQRAKIKARQRAELEAELAPWAADVGQEINSVRNATSASIQDIADIIGIQNRTFIYKMLNAAKSAGLTVDEPVRPLPQKEIVITGLVEDDVAYTIDYFDGVAKVTFDDDVSTEYYDIVVVDGTPDLPDEWAEHTKERRAMYKDIAKAIRDHYKG